MSKLDKIKHYLSGRIQLRRCTSLGLYPQVEGKVFVRNAGTMRLGDRIRIRGNHVPVELAVYRGAELTIGDSTFINSGASICAQQSVYIGQNCRIGNYALIMDSDFHVVGNLDAWPTAAPVRIEDNVWLAARVTVLKGVTIGEGAVVAAGAVVTKDVAPHTLVGGVPARLIRKIDSPFEEATASG
jgi:acetyltransferase-like isoleucine patch superfamily enzyme